MYRSEGKKIGLIKGCLAGGLLSLFMFVGGVLMLLVPVIGWILGPIMMFLSLGSWGVFLGKWEGPCPVCGKKIEIGQAANCPYCKNRVVREKKTFVCHAADNSEHASQRWEPEMGQAQAEPKARLITSNGLRSGCGCVCVVILLIAGSYWLTFDQGHAPRSGRELGVEPLQPSEPAPAEVVDSELVPPMPASEAVPVEAIETEPRTSVPDVSAPVIFDIPSLVGRSIDGIRKLLGNPEDKEQEPTKLQLQTGINEWENHFSPKLQQGQGILGVTNDKGEQIVSPAVGLNVRFNARTRHVIVFHLQAYGADQRSLMQLGNLKEGDPTYRIEPVKAVYWQEKPVQGQMKARPPQPGEPKLMGIDVHPLLSESQRAELDKQEAEQARWRTWTTADGKYKVDAAFRGVTAGTVRLERQDGVIVSVPVDRLSAEDKTWIDERRRSHR